MGRRCGKRAGVGGENGTGIGMLNKRFFYKIKKNKKFKKTSTTVSLINIVGKKYVHFSHTMYKLKCIKNLNIKPQNIKLVKNECKIGSY